MRKFLERGQAGGKSFGRGFRKAAKKEIDDISRNPGAAGMKMNLGAMPIIGAGLLAAGIASQVSASLQKAFEQERLTISFNALSADGGGGSRIFENLREDALRTGQEISSMAGMVQRFMGLGFAEKDALELNSSLLDIAGSLGMTAYEAAGLGAALAQVQAKGVASMEELRQQIAEKGVPVFQVLAQKLGVTEAAVISMVSAGKVGADVVIEAFQNLEGPLERFRGGADRLASSAGGMFERVKREAEDLKMIFGAAILPELKLLLSDVILALKGMKDDASAFGKAMGNVLGNIRAAVKSLGLIEMMHYAALTYKKTMAEAFVFIQKAGYATVKMFGGEEFGKGLERAALTFKAIMLAAASEILEAMAAGAESLPGGKNNRVFNAFKNAAHLARGNSMVASALSEAVEPADLKKITSKWKEDFKGAPAVYNFTKGQQAELDRMDAAVAKFRKNEKPGIKPEEPLPPSASTTTTAAAAMQPGGLLAGGLANALSRISGGASTLLMTRQLDAMQSTATAVQQNVTATQNVSKAVDRLTQKISVFS
jgi:tape measure domain-containing protein